jgi:hypothetical protein
MLNKALDLLRTLGWYIVDFIYSLIDSLFDVLKSLNAFDIVNSIAKNSIFSNFYTGVIAIALTLLGLFTITRFIKKVLNPDEEMPAGKIYKEVAICGILIIMSTFLFAQASTFSIKLAGFTGSIFEQNNISLSDSMLTMYIDYSEGYKATDDFKNEDISKYIKNDKFTKKKMYNDKYVTDDKWILPDEEDYKYSINWIMAILVGGFFLYSLFFSGMMLARRQIEFLFLFTISPIIFATSVGNKERRSAVFQQLVSLILQGAVIMLIITLTALIMQQINDTTFFTNTFKDILIKTILYIGCGSFLLTGSQVVNRFIGGNVSANSGREQLMAMMGFGQSMGAVASVGGLATAGAGLLGAGATLKGASAMGSVGNTAMQKIGNAMSSFGSKIGGNIGDVGSPTISGIGGNLQAIGSVMSASAYRRAHPIDSSGKSTMNSSQKLSRFASNMMSVGTSSIGSAVNTVLPTGMGRHRRR